MKYLSVRFFIVLSLLFFSTGIQTGERPYIAVIEKIAGAVGFYTEEGKELCHVKIGSFPHEAVLSKDGNLLYVSHYGLLWTTDEGEGGNTISITNVRTMKKIGEINLGEFIKPHGVALVPGTDSFLTTTEKSSSGLILIDLNTRKILRDYYTMGKGPHMIAPSPDGKFAFVSNTESGTVAAVNLQTGKVKLLPTSARPQGGVISPDGNRLYVVNTGGNQISIIDTKKLKVVDSIATGKGPGRIAITPDGKTLVYNLQFEPGVGFADVDSCKQVEMVSLIGRPLSLTMTRDGKRAFVGVQDQDKIFYISIPERRIERIIETPKGSGPDPVIPLERNESCR